MSAPIVVTTTSIGTDTTLERAQRVVDYLRDRGWDAVLGDVTDLPQSEEFLRDWYAACEKAWRGR